MKCLRIGYMLILHKHCYVNMFIKFHGSNPTTYESFTDIYSELYQCNSCIVKFRASNIVSDIILIRKPCAKLLCILYII